MGAFLMIIIDDSKTVKGKAQKFVLRAWQYWSCILMSAFILLSLMLWPYQDVQNYPDDRWSADASSMYYALGRPAWGFGLAFLTFAFKYMNEDTENTGDGQKSVVKAFLSLEIWQPLGKLTYVMYLIHLMVYTVWISDAENPTYYTEWSELLLVLGVWTIVASLGLVLWFVMERPLANLVTLFLKWIAGGGQSAKREQHREEALLADDGV